MPKEDIPACYDFNKIIADKNEVVTFCLSNARIEENTYWISLEYNDKDLKMISIEIKHPELWEDKIVPNENDGIKRINEIENKITQLSFLKQEMISYFGLENIILDPYDNGCQACYGYDVDISY